LSVSHQRRVHFLTLEVGEEFRFEPGGKIFRRIVGKDERAWVEDKLSHAPPSVLDYSGCYVYLVSEEETESDEEMLQ
jgi:hypothetical protein